MPNIIDQIIRENYIQENQTLISDLHHFPKSLIIDNTTKISAKSAVVDLLPENYNVLENDIKSFNQNDQKDRKVSQNLRTRLQKKKSRKQQYVINRAQKLLSYDEKLKNWNIDPEVFDDLEIEIITQVTSGLIPDYPESFKIKYPHFLCIHVVHDTF